MTLEEILDSRTAKIEALEEQLKLAHNALKAMAQLIQPFIDENKRLNEEIKKWEETIPYMPVEEK